MQTLFEFFTDPVLMAPTIGSMLMCFVGALVGTFAVLKRVSLISEMLSHACYPGVAIALMLLSFAPVAELASHTFALWVMLGACLSCALGLFLQFVMKNRFKIKQDATLTFILASFFGLALVLVTSVQNSMPTLYKRMQSYLFGQAATMTMDHVWLYLALTFFVVCIVCLYGRLMKVSIFDPEFARVNGMNTSFADALLLGLIVVATVIGIRAVGVVLMSSMIIFPPVCARLWTDRFIPMIRLSCVFGLVFGFFGIFFSHTLSITYKTTFASGPMIVLVAGFVFLVSVLVSKKKGLIVRLSRRISFWYRCQQENILKAIWKYAEAGPITLSEVQAIFHENRWIVWLLMSRLIQRGLCRRTDRRGYVLTASGTRLARKIIRFHRLWEVYLVEYCGVSRDRVHPSAEEMEHIITPEIELELERLLNDPLYDPHHQRIPPHEVCT